MKRIKNYDPRKIVLSAYMSKHKSCTACQTRWSDMKKRFNWNEPPRFLQHKAKNNGDINDLITMLWEKKNG